MALSKKKPRELSIKEKVMVIQQKESEGKSQRNLLRFSALARLKYRTHLKERQMFWLHMTTIYRMTGRGLESTFPLRACLVCAE